MPSLLLVSVVPLFAAFLLGAVDGLYFHLRRYRLFAFPESRGEHVLHTVRAFLVLPPLALLYLADAAGLCLWTVAAAIAIDQLMLALDLREEATSRRRFGLCGKPQRPITTPRESMPDAGFVIADTGINQPPLTPPLRLR